MTTGSVITRNSSCPCGSGRRTKRCCGVAGNARGVADERTFLGAAAKARVDQLRGSCEDCIDQAWAELVALVEADPACWVQLPVPLPALLARLGQALADHDDAAVDAALVQAKSVVDTVTARTRLARVMLAHEADGSWPATVVAVALADLVAARPSVLMEVGLVQVLSPPACRASRRHAVTRQPVRMRR